jgi:hypothetical protein
MGARFAQDSAAERGYLVGTENDRSGSGDAAGFREREPSRELVGSFVGSRALLDVWRHGRERKPKPREQRSAVG